MKETTQLDLMQGTGMHGPLHLCSLYTIMIYCCVTFFMHGVHCAGLSDFLVRGAARQHFSRPVYTVFIVQAYQTSQYVAPCGSIFLSKWHGSFAGNSDSKMNAQSSCALNTQ
jgi:hypothetical protein